MLQQLSPTLCPLDELRLATKPKFVATVAMYVGYELQQ